MQLGVDDVLQLSPDESSRKAARGLVIPAKWPRLEFDDEAVWGECQGSGSKPYQVQVDRAGPAFRCSCPSRKFPCKHGLALLLLLAQHGPSFSAGAQPAWVSEWLSTRRQRSDRQESKKAVAAGAEAEADPQGASRREAARLARMSAGLDELERWLNDRLRQGLAQLSGQPALWQDIALRMVDAQLPGLAFRLRRIAARVDQGEQWPARVLGGLGQLRLLIDAFRRLDALATPLQADVRSALGLTTEREAVLASGERVADDWLVVGQSIDEEERLWVRRVWLQGLRSGRRGLLLDFAHGARRFEDVHPTASCMNATLAFFPGNSALRAVVAGMPTRLPAAALPGSGGLAAALDALSLAVAANPWQWPQPFLVGDGVPRLEGGGWCLQGPGRECLKLTLRAEDGWRLLAESGGRPLTLFGEWDGETLRPLSAWGAGLVWTEETEAA